MAWSGAVPEAPKLVVFDLDACVWFPEMCESPTRTTVRPPPDALFSAAAARRSLPDVQCVVPRRRHTPRHAHTARHPAQICSWAVAARRSDSTPLRTR